MKPAAHAHDRANLVVLPALGALMVAGIAGRADPMAATYAMIAYIVADFAWIAAVPDAVPSLPGVILAHHAVTLALLAFPLRHARLAVYTCWDGVVEVNTFFLIARRQWRGWRRPLSAAYWATFVPLRLGVYPALLVVFAEEARGLARWEGAVILGCQAALVGFNAMLVWLSVQNWRRGAGRKPAVVAEAAAAEAAAAGAGRRRTRASAAAPAKGAPRAAVATLRARSVAVP